MRLLLSVVGVLAVLAVLGIRWRRRWLAQEQQAVDQRIRANRAQPKPAFAQTDDSLRIRTLAQRAEAERLRRRAAQVDSGVPLPSRGDLRAVK